MKKYWIPSIKIRGYRPFRDIEFKFDPIEVIVGANGSGKSSLFEFLKFLRNACYQEIPLEIVTGTIGQQIFHKPGQESLWWSAEIDSGHKVNLYYQGELIGPVGATKIIYENVKTSKPLADKYDSPYVFMNFKNGKGGVSDPREKKLKRKE